MKRTKELIPATEAEQYRKQISIAEKYATSLQILSDEDYSIALSKGKDIKVQLDAVVARKEEMTKPINTALKSIRDFFRSLENAGENALGIIKEKMIEYTKIKDRKAEEAKQKLAERVERGTMKPETAVAKIEQIKEQPKTVVTDNGSATTKTVTKYRVTDISKVPVEYLLVDMVKVKSAFKAGIVVSGCEAYEEKELAFNY